MQVAVYPLYPSYNTYYILSSSARGLSHYENNIVCQDYAISGYENSITYLIVCDGCGSSALSEYGSKITAESVKTLFLRDFDKLYNLDFNKKEEHIQFNKTLVEEIYNATRGFIGKEFRTTFIPQLEKEKENSMFRKIIKKGFYKKLNENEIAYLTEYLYSTIIFFFEKDGNYIIGQIGDGFLGLEINKEYKIILQESKNFDVNETIYPTNIYYLAKTRPEKDDWYLDKSIRIKKTTSSINPLSTVILSTDGVDSIITKEEQNGKFINVYRQEYLSRILKEIKTSPDPSRTLDDIVEKLAKESSTCDDCSVALLIKT